MHEDDTIEGMQGNQLPYYELLHDIVELSFERPHSTVAASRFWEIATVELLNWLYCEGAFVSTRKSKYTPEENYKMCVKFLTYESLSRKQSYARDMVFANAIFPFLLRNYK